MRKKIIFILILAIISIVTMACNSHPTTRTTQSSTSHTTSSTATSQTTTKPDMVVGTIQEAWSTLEIHLANIAQSQNAKTVLTDFYNYFQHQEIYVWNDSTLIQAESDTQLLWIDFESWEIAYFVSAPNWDLFPELFNGIFTFEQELVHPASDGTPASYTYTMALRWSIDPISGDVMTKNQNAQRFEAELSK